MHLLQSKDNANNQTKAANKRHVWKGWGGTGEVFKGRLLGKSIFPCHISIWHGNNSPVCVYAFKVENGRKWSLLMRSAGTVSSGMSCSIIFLQKLWGDYNTSRRWPNSETLWINEVLTVLEIILCLSLSAQNICMDFISSLKLGNNPFVRVPQREF